MRILLNQRIEHQHEDKILVVREFDPADEYREEYGANTFGTVVDISLDDSRLNEPVEDDSSGDAFDVTLTVAILD